MLHTKTTSCGEIDSIEFYNKTTLTSDEEEKNISLQILSKH